MCGPSGSCDPRGTKSDIYELKKKMPRLRKRDLDTMATEIKDLEHLSRFKPDVLMVVLEDSNEVDTKLCEKIIMEAQEILEARQFYQRDADYSKRGGGVSPSASPNHGGSSGSSPDPRTKGRKSGKLRKAARDQAMTEAREVMKPLEEAKGKTEDETPPSNDEKPGSVATSYINPQRTLDDWMRATKKVLSETVFMPLEMIVENPWNPNMGTPEEDESLEQVMIEQGPENIWPVTVRPQAQTVFVNDTALKVHQIVDGSRRFRKAKKLKWERMLVRIRYDLDDLAAMKLTMQMNRHGHTDWYKEARLYGSVPAKYTDKEVAAMFKVSDSHISRRKVLLALKEEDVRKAQGLGVQVTVLEEIAKMEDPKARDEAMKKVVSGDKKIVEEVKESKTKKYLCPKCHVQSPTDKYLKCERCNLYYPMKAPKKEKKDEKKEEEKKRLQKEFPHANLEKKGR